MTLARLSASARYRLPRTFACAAALAVLATGCASTKLSDVAINPTLAAMPPSSLRIEVALASQLREQKAAVKVARTLKADLLEHYRKAGLPVATHTRTLSAQAIATIRVEIVEAEAGSTAKRMLLGFGAGRSTLATHTTIWTARPHKGRPDAAREATMTFSTSASDGSKPGLILPGGIAAVTGEASRVAIGAALGTLAETRSGLGRQAARSADLIVRQTRRFYHASGWLWPADKPGKS